MSVYVANVLLTCLRIALKAEWLVEFSVTTALPPIGYYRFTFFTNVLGPLCLCQTERQKEEERERSAYYWISQLLRGYLSTFYTNDLGCFDPCLLSRIKEEERKRSLRRCCVCLTRKSEILDVGYRSRLLCLKYYSKSRSLLGNFHTALFILFLLSKYSLQVYHV